MAENQKNIQTKSEAWILIKIQCVIYQLIRLDKLYKQREIFFSNFKLVFEFLSENRKIFKQIARHEY